MTTKLQYLQQQVAAHMALKEASDNGRIIMTKGEPIGYNSRQDAAMQLLADLLLLLEAAVEWDKMDSDIEFDESVMICDALSDKVQKLLEEVEE